MLTNFDIENICDYYEIPLLGVVMKDDLPNKVTDGNFIINLESSVDKNGNEGKGTHWLALVVKGSQSFFFDSFGAYPSIEIVNYIKRRKGLHLTMNNMMIQNIQSENCGYYCISLLLYLKHNEGSLFNLAERYTEIYADDTMKNDAILRNIFKGYSVKPYLPLIKRLMNEKRK